MKSECGAPLERQGPSLRVVRCKSTHPEDRTADIRTNTTFFSPRGDYRCGLLPVLF